MTSYRLLTYDFNGRPRAGLLVNGFVHDVAEITGAQGSASVFDLLQDWDRSLRILARAADDVASGDDGQPLDMTHLCLPIVSPVGVFCAGANYRDHVLEMARVSNLAPEPDPKEAGLKSWHFIKHYRCLVGPGAHVPLPRASHKVDWEAELAVVIGRKACNVSVADALSHVAGYAIADDLSARDLSRRAGISPTSPFYYDWLGQKNFDGACPFGPWITPAAEIADPQNLSIELRVNDEVMQQSNTSEMIFGVAEQIAHLSEKLTLHPGDIICTGTPAGVGSGRGKFLKAGDRVSIRIEKLGELSHDMI